MLLKSQLFQSKYHSEHLLSFLRVWTVPIIDRAESFTGTLHVLTGQVLLLGCLLPGWNVRTGSRTYYEHGVVRCEALTVFHVLPASAWTGNNESQELMGESEDRAGTDDTLSSLESPTKRDPTDATRLSCTHWLTLQLRVDCWSTGVFSSTEEVMTLQHLVCLFFRVC